MNDVILNFVFRRVVFLSRSTERMKLEEVIRMLVHVTQDMLTVCACLPPKQD